MIGDERGISTVELLVVLGITGLITGILVTAIYQIYQVTGWGNSTLVVQHDLQNAATWLNRDVLTATRAKVDVPATGIYTMTLEVPYLSVGEAVTLTIHNIIYNYSEETGTLTRASGDSSRIIARHISANPFPPSGSIVSAPDPVMITLHSTKGDVPGSGTFALKMRAGGSMSAAHLCQITGAETLVITPTSKTVQWDITNNGTTSPSIDEIYIAWPSENDDPDLACIYFNDHEDHLIYYGCHTPPSATISSGWLGFSGREIISGTQKTLEFEFSSTDVITDELQYSITVTFTNNCTVSFLPTP